jgi:hypothetical protein
MKAMPSRNLMGIIMAALAVLLSPVLLLTFALLALTVAIFLAVPLCHKLDRGPLGGISACANCSPDFCPLVILLFTLVILPLALVALFILKKRSRLP